MVMHQTVIVEIMALVVLDLVMRTAAVLLGLVPAIHRAAAHAVRGEILGVRHG